MSVSLHRKAAEIDGILHVLVRTDDATYTACSELPLSETERLDFVAPDGSAWKPLEHEHACLVCFAENFGRKSNGGAPPPAAAWKQASPDALACSECPKTFTTQQGLAIHRGQSHKRPRPERPVAKSSEEHPCPNCDRVFGSTMALGGHRGNSACGKVAKVLEVVDKAETASKAAAKQPLPAQPAPPLPAPAGLRIVQLLVEARFVDQVLEDIQEACSPCIILETQTARVEVIA